MATDVTREVERRVLILAPTAKDAEVTRAVLAQAAVPCVVCENIDCLVRDMGEGASAVLLTEDVFTAKNSGALATAFEGQPVWSDMPAVILMRGGDLSRAAGILRSMRNVTLLERPAPMRSVVSAVQAAVRARAWQYQLREQFEAMRQAEARARELQEQLALALDASELGIFHCPMPLGKIVWNERCKAHFWLPPDAEVDIDLFYALLHPDDRDATRRAIEASIHDANPYEIEYRTISPRGEVRWVRATGRTYFDNNHEPLRFDGTTQDVTIRKAAEEEREALLRSEQAARVEVERASRMKDEFLATLSHELRTPLNAILGWSQLLKRDGHEQIDPETLAEGLAVIERNARAQTQLIEDLLDMSRIISGKIRLDTQLVNPISFIEAAIETVKPAAEARGIRLQTVLDANAGPISGDPNRLQQVVWNLLSNAIKFTPRGGRVQVLLERVNSHVELSVSDTGQGISADFLPHVFERFRQADASTTRKHGGLGLGLAIVKQLVELHGGGIAAMSPGQGAGSTFTVSLPLAAVHRDLGEPRREHPRAPRLHGIDLGCASLKGLKVLVVDDEPDARALIKRLLENCDALVTVAGSMAEALPLVESNRPDVLLSDIGMPDADGYELLRRVRALGQERGGNVPAVALTAFARSEDRTRALLAGFVVHVSKPVEPSELVATVASVGGRTGR